MNKQINTYVDYVWDICISAYVCIYIYIYRAMGLGVPSRGDSKSLITIPSMQNQLASQASRYSPKEPRQRG